VDSPNVELISGIQTMWEHLHVYVVCWPFIWF